MKTTMQLLAMSILTLMYLLIMGLSSTVYATSHYDPDVWKNEGIYTPLTPFESFDWSEETYADFANQFANWSANMDQSYYPIMDAEEIRQENDVNNTDIQIEDHTFRGFHFEEIVKNAFVDGYKVGFTYQAIVVISIVTGMIFLRCTALICLIRSTYTSSQSMWIQKSQLFST